MSRHQGGVLSCASFKEAIAGKDGAEPSRAARPPESASGIAFPFPLPNAHEAELALIREALARTGGNKTLAAEMIGMARQTFRTKLKELDPAGPA